MSLRQGTRLHLLLFSIVYLSYDLALWGLLEGDFVWLSGYKVILLVAAVKSFTSYAGLEVNTLLARTRHLQCSALATTCQSEVLALYREDKLSASNIAKERYSKTAFGLGEQIPFNPYDQHNPAPVFWCSLVAVMVLYNTAHLALVPLSCTLPLLFGTPAYVLYWGAMRTTSIMLG